jgi:hypothetical protein
MGRMFQNVLRADLAIENPYVHRTKAEVVEVISRSHRALVPIANSCWRNARLTKGTHCGACVPCYTRRIAIETQGTDETAYARDVWRENVAGLSESDDGRRNLVDVLEFITRINELSPAEIMNEWPELYTRDLSAPDVIAMYKRFAGEALRVFSRYPLVQALL